jgi:hypothetical protein
MCHYIEPLSQAITLTISSKIVDVVIGDMLWHPTDMEGQTRENALSLFKRKEDGSYLVVINKSKQFLLATRFVGRGMSFAMAADAVNDAKEVCDIPKLGACSDFLVSSYARVACALSIEHISQVLCSKWAFSVAFDASTDLQQTSWVDVRIRYYQNSALENLHLITLPFAGRHTGLATFDMFVKLFDAVCPLWKDKLIGCSTDGAANMTGRLSGVVTRIQNVVKPNFMRVWCLLHQIDIIMQKVYKRAGCNFYKLLTSIISFLRRQKNLVEEMQAICPNLSATRWASMSRVARFLVEKRSEIVTYFAETEPSDRFDQLPTPAFWIMISVISEISTHVSECVEGLQGRRVTLQQQTAAVQSLLDCVQRFAFVELAPADEILPAAQDVVVLGERQVSFADLTGFIQDQGIFASRTLAELDPEESTEVLNAVGEILLSIVNGLSSVEALRDEVNDASTDGMPPCLPHELLKLKPRDVVQLVLKFHDRLSASWTQNSIDLIVDQHKKLLSAVSKEPRLQTALARHNEQTDFSEAWMTPSIKDRFPELMEFCGGLCSPFPNTATVESDFSVLKWEKDLHRSKLTPFSLEGILHCRQIRSLLKH